MNSPDPVQSADGLVLHVVALVVGAGFAWLSTKLNLSVDTATKTEIAAGAGMAAVTVVHWLESKFTATFSKVGLS